ncbi:c-type cytochrome [Curvivirga sp.]|uniref:c-type cytochrome n=1 Tax=Curvivirga sp. TaxID=2856848 RepID=UPI003B5C990A
MKKVIAATTVVSALFVATAFGHGGATGVVKERMDLMGNLKSAIKILVPMMKGDQEYDIEKVITQSKIIQENSGIHMTKGFPKDSIHGPSEAKEEIWSNWDDFQKIANDLNKLAIGLEKAAANPFHKKGQMMNNSSMMGQSMMQMGQGNMADNMNLDDMPLDQMPPNGVFKMITQNCSACHTKYRIEN